ncbi:DUF3343 domain-containing protein [Aneurinibacillus terranovensis]|uniref:DUF3343 domain-containing protein n=1 Tax=Aneurinibacillus terranovensis TaxID=278991 RepID=UPI0006884C69|nr:DUF3343 domain-containing protein [Aneurinibacillus terranovensis]
MNNKILIAFDSTQQALRAEMLLEYADIEIDTRPTPKEITAGCALSIDIPHKDFQTVSKIISHEKVEIKGYYYKRIDKYELYTPPMVEGNGGE